jgi:hypothetical protein
MEIRISKSNRNCAASACEFEHGAPITSVVRVEENEYIREDYCREHWDAEQGPGAVAVWTREYYDPKVAEEEAPEVFSPLRQLFYESVEAEGRIELAKSYLAAQLLRRQKVFRLIKEADDPEGMQKVALFSDRIGNRLIEVRDPNLSYAEIEEGRRLLMKRLAELEQLEVDEPAEVEAGESQPENAQEVQN